MSTNSKDRNEGAICTFRGRAFQADVAGPAKDTLAPVLGLKPGPVCPSN